MSILTRHNDYPIPLEAVRDMTTTLNWTRQLQTERLPDTRPVTSAQSDGTDRDSSITEQRDQPPLTSPLLIRTEQHDKPSQVVSPRSDYLCQDRSTHIDYPKPLTPSQRTSTCHLPSCPLATKRLLTTAPCGSNQCDKTCRVSSLLNRTTTPVNSRHAGTQLF